MILEGTYDSRRNFRVLSDSSIEPLIKVRRNASLKAEGCMPRQLSIIGLKVDLDTWKENHEYGHKWTTESIFSVFWCIFGERMKAVSWKNR